MNRARNVFRNSLSRSLSRTSLWTIALLTIMLLASRAVYAATYTVTDTTDDAGDTGSLRYAVNSATSGSDVIQFSGVTGTIVLTNGTLAINHSVTINGPGAGLLTISGNNATTVFTIGAGATAAIGGLRITNGSTTAQGGAIDNNGTLTLTKCAFSSNTATQNGGAIYSLGALTVTDSIFTGNTSTAGGGGAIGAGGTLITVENSTFLDNTSGAGGGILAGNAVVENSTFYGNVTTGGGPGGGIFNNGGALTVSNSTVTGNTGDGIWNNGGTITVTNSIVAGNTGGDCQNCGTQSPNNLIGGAPGLGPLRYNGGIAKTMMPLPGSPAIGAGSNSTLATDERGFARPTGGASDLGAVQTNYLTVNTLSDSTDTTSCTGGATCSLRDAIALVNSAGSGDIVFQSGLTGTITLGSAVPLPSITGDVNLAGPGANVLTIQGGVLGTSVFNFSNANAVTSLSGLTITGPPANSSVQGAGLSNEGLLLVESCNFTFNFGGNGGGIFNDASGSATVLNSTFNTNVAAAGGGVYNVGKLVVANSTFTVGAGSSGGGGIASIGAPALALVENSTFYGNYSITNGRGAGVYNTGSVTLYNNILASNLDSGTGQADDCSGCGTTDPSNQIGGVPTLGALAYNGVNATVKTMLPLPGSPAIQAGTLGVLPAELTTDERGFPRTTGGLLDVGAAQTNYTGIQFVQQPTNTAINATMSPAVTLEVLETNTNLSAPNNTDAVNGIPLTLTFNGTGTLGGTLTQTTTGGVASFGDLNVNAVGTGDTLATSLTITPATAATPITLTATSNPFDITLLTQTINFVAPPSPVTYGVAPITLTATSSAGLPVTLQVDSGPATISGNILTITGGGTVVVEADAAASGNYAAATPVTHTILVNPAASSLALTASATSAAAGTSVTLTATASSATPGATATPTGTVTFKANGNSIGTGTLSGGVATLALTTLPVGSNAITASYAGDTNYTGSTAQLAGAIVVGTPGFTMTSSASSLTVQPGGIGTVTLTLTSTFGYAGAIHFSCSGLPIHSSCNFAPTSVVLNGSPTPVTAVLTVATNVAGQSLRRDVAQLLPLHPLRGLPMLPAMFFWLPGTELAFVDREDARKKKRRTRSHGMLWMMALSILVVGLLSLTGCGGSSFNTPAGQQTVTITATGPGGVSQSVAVQLSVS